MIFISLRSSFKIVQLLVVELDLMSGPSDFGSETSFFMPSSPPESGLWGHQLSPPLAPLTLLGQHTSSGPVSQTGYECPFSRVFALVRKPWQFSRECDAKEPGNFRALPFWSPQPLFPFECAEVSLNLPGWGSRRWELLHGRHHRNVGLGGWQLESSGDSLQESRTGGPERGAQNEALGWALGPWPAGGKATNV